jgi:hypothetical protein
LLSDYNQLFVDIQEKTPLSFCAVRHIRGGRRWLQPCENESGKMNQ